MPVQCCEASDLFGGRTDTTHYPLPTTHYPLPTTHYPLRTIEPILKKRGIMNMPGAIAGCCMAPPPPPPFAMNIPLGAPFMFMFMLPLALPLALFCICICGWLVGLFVGWSVGLLVCWFVGWLANIYVWLADWLVDGEAG